MPAQSMTRRPAPVREIQKRAFFGRPSATGLLAWSFALVWLIVTTLPVLWIFNIVFSKGGSEVALSPHLYPTSISSGFVHLQQALSQASFLQAYLVSTAYALVQVSGMLLIVSMAAYEFTFYDFPGKTTLFLIALSGLMMPFAVTLIPLYRIVTALGWANSLQGLAVPGMASAFGLFVLRQFMESIPRELLDAARIDGASHFGVYWRIVLPLSRNALLTISILSFIAAWGNYIWPLVITTKPEWYTISVTMAQFFGFQSYTTIEIVMASALLAAFPPIILYVFLQRYIIEGIAVAGLKG
ncbi:MAG TPA: carbohydrate ABC transporter permease [Chthoniobacterales bacterium]|nr:carbohydrate ABC transporter permease [Chthoniobacterales bacterium]